MSLKIAFIGAGSRSFARRVLGDVVLSDPLCGQGLEKGWPWASRG